MIVVWLLMLILIICFNLCEAETTKREARSDTETEEITRAVRRLFYSKKGGTAASEVNMCVAPRSTFILSAGSPSKVLHSTGGVKMKKFGPSPNDVTNLRANLLVAGGAGWEPRWPRLSLGEWPRSSTHGPPFEGYLGHRGSDPLQHQIGRLLPGRPLQRHILALDWPPSF